MAAFLIRRLIGCALALSAAAAIAASEGVRPFENSPFGEAVAMLDGSGSADVPVRGENQVALIGNGYDALLLRVHLIRNARATIDVQTFIWSNDECGRLLMYELIEAARRGVKVRIIADTLFSDQDRATAAFVATVHPNLEVKHYRTSLSRLKASPLHTIVASVQSFHDVNQRMHNKVMVFDDAILLTGGRNIENTYYDHSTEMNYRDRDVLAVGPVVHEAVVSFEEFWSFPHAVRTGDLPDVQAVIAKGNFRRYPTRADFDFGGFFQDLVREADDASVIRQRFTSRLRTVARARFICDQPGKTRGFFSKTARITKELRSALSQAQANVTIQTPYLVLSNPARKLIRDLQRQHPGLRVRISSNSFASTDNLFAYSANYRLRNRYVQDLKLEVHEFRAQPASLTSLLPHYDEIATLAKTRINAGRQSRMPFLSIHAKSMVIDDRLVFVGSYNLDPRSENLNTEAGLLIEDETIAKELRAEIEADMRPENSWLIARRALPLRLDAVNELVGGLLSLSPIDVWPIQNTSSFELRPGAVDVSPDDPAFHAHYQEAGAFPGTEGLFTTKEILTRLYKAVGAPLTPIL
jgi:phosphatidylserine/phosphatidylglycerophosphate/cardiolipin synthase-like enzyme